MANYQIQILHVRTLVLNLDLTVFVEPPECLALSFVLLCMIGAVLICPPYHDCYLVR